MTSAQRLLAAAWHTPLAALVLPPTCLLSAGSDAAGPPSARGTLIAQFTSLLL